MIGGEVWSGVIKSWRRRWKKSAIYYVRVPTQRSHLFAASVKYLGVHIDRKLKFCKQTKYTINKAKTAKALLFPILNSKASLPISRKLHIYKTYIRPILLYAAPAWTPNISNHSWTKLEGVQSISLRQLSGVKLYVNNRAILNSIKVSTICKVVQKKAKSLSERTLQNKTVKSLEKKPYTWRSNKGTQQNTQASNSK